MRLLLLPEDVSTDHYIGLGGRAELAWDNGPLSVLRDRQRDSAATSPPVERRLTSGYARILV